MKKRVLISVSDKSNIVEFAKGLVKHDFEVISTGGTYAMLKEAGISPLYTVEHVTTFPEGMNGRIKTLHPRIFGGLLADQNKENHKEFLLEQNLPTFDLVVVNLYPFKNAYQKENATFEQIVEQIDIGGPSMIRAAAKNWQWCVPVVDPADYNTVLQQISEKGITQDTKKRLASKVFEMTAHYDMLIAKFWRESAGKSLRYGENPHQSAVFVPNPFDSGAGFNNITQIQGKPLSFNNYADASAALELALMFNHEETGPFATILKHAQPCGAAVGDTLPQAFEKALEGDPVSAFGGIMAVNMTLDAATAEKMIQFFNEVVIAPDFTPEALEIFKKKKNLRVIKVNNWKNAQRYAVKSILGGTLVQDADQALPIFKNLEVICGKPTQNEQKDAEMAWKLVKIVRSNGIVAVKDGQMVGKGGGQTSRVLAMQQTITQAGEKAKNAVIASDAFFPFADNIEICEKAGISCVIQPGGSIRDAEVTAAAEKAGISMIFTEMRSFLH